MKNSPKPPRFGTWILKQIYGNRLFNEVSGDLEELFSDRARKHGKFLASIRYLTDSLLSVRNLDLRSGQNMITTNKIGIIRNNAKTTLRILNKNRVQSGVVILGLAIGLSASLFIFQYISFERSYDQFHKNQRNIYRVAFKDYRNGELQRNSASAGPRIGPYLKEKLPAVIEFTRIHRYEDITVSYNDKKFREDRVLIVDQQFLDIFDFPLLEGNNKTALSGAKNIVISQKASEKYFGQEDPMGKILSLDHGKIFQVTGVAQDPPANSHIKFDFLLSYDVVDLWFDEAGANSWGYNVFHTYIVLQPETEVRSFEVRLNNIIYNRLKKAFTDYNFRYEFTLQPIAEIHLHSNLELELMPSEQGDGKAVSYLTVIAIFILVIAWINYSNLTSARSIERAKEVGIRKVLGAFRSQVIFQFIFESLLLNFFSLALAIILSIVAIKSFNNYAGSDLDLNFIWDVQFWGIALILTFIGSILSGIHPAIVLSSYGPVQALKGHLRSNLSGRSLRKLLIVFQFTVSIGLISATVVILSQINFMNNQDLGFAKNQLIVFRGPDYDEMKPSSLRQHHIFLDELRQISGVSSVAGGSGIPGEEIDNPAGVKFHLAPIEETKVIKTLWVDPDYLPALGIKFLAGRKFSDNYKLDTSSVILNLSAVKMLGYESPIAAVDQKLNLGLTSEPWQIIGIIEDYNHLSVKKTVDPLLIGYNKWWARYYVVRLSSSDKSSILASIESVFKEFYPQNPFSYFFLDSYFNHQYQDEQKFSHVFIVFACLAIFIACLGLYGLSVFNATRRTKEIGIRKVLGADFSQIAILLSREYLILIMISSLIACPLIYFLMEEWLNNFATRISIHPFVFLFSGLAVVVIAMITVGQKTLSCARSNPVNELRYE